MSDLDARLWREVWSRIWRFSAPTLTPFVSFDGKHYRVGFFDESGAAATIGMGDSLESAMREVESMYAETRV